MTSENGLLGLGCPSTYEMSSWVMTKDIWKTVSEERTEVTCSKFVAIDTNDTLSHMDLVSLL